MDLLNMEYATDQVESATGELLSFILPDTRSHLCHCCKAMMLAVLSIDNPDHDSSAVDDNDESDPFQPHQTSWRTLFEASSSGCVICRSICRGALGPSYDPDYDPHLNTRVTSFFWGTTQKADALEPSYFLNLQVDSTGEDDDDEARNFGMSFIMRPYLDIDNTLLEMKPKGKEDRAAQVHKWIADCSALHAGRCSSSKANQGEFMPSRLLRIRRDSDDVPGILVNLHETASDGPVDEYLTLSHRWGGHDMFKLEMQSRQAMRLDIPFHNIPNMMKEVIDFALDLMGHQTYIWIDCLCIIQDSYDDWLVEAERMGDIYAHSYLNIGATASSGPHDSLRQEIHHRSAPVTPCFFVQNKLRGLYTMICHKAHESEVDNGALNKRAWVLQERALSPRMLHFGASQLYWECDELLSGETYPSGFPGEGGVKPLRPFKHILENQGTMNTAGDTADFKLEWNRIVSKYMQCGITYTSDRLLAIASLAARLSRTYKDEYFAGMWKSHLPVALLWAAASPFFVFPKPYTHRPANYIAPSWSWASVEGPVFFTESQTRSGVAALVLDIQVTGKSSSTYGLVSSGSINLLGYLVPAFWNLKHCDSVQARIGLWPEIQDGIAYEGHTAIPDDMALVRPNEAGSNVTTSHAPHQDSRNFGSSSNEDLFCFPIVLPRDFYEVTEGQTSSSKIDHYSRRIAGLILQRADAEDASSRARAHENYFRRVGLFWIENKSARRHFQDAYQTQFTVI